MALTVPKTAFAGAIFEAFLARFKASMAVFNAETAPSLSLGCWDSTSMVETWSLMWWRENREGWGL